MESNSIPTLEVENDSTKVPNWLDLPIDLTTNILLRLDVCEILTSACGVCSLWWNICKDPLMWRTINLGDQFEFPSKFRFTLDLEKICFDAVKRSCDHLEEVDLDQCATDDLLKCIANNGSHLHSMRLLECWQISNHGFCEAVRKLQQLEKVDISLSHLSVDSLEVLGRSCPRLKSLKYYLSKRLLYYRSDARAFVVAETMPGLCHLDFRGHELSDVGLVAILDNCPLLKSLDIRRCRQSASQFK
ncbi:putative F-box/LRR-repeat protein 23 [Vicia villosa]|uniref:putative F-box/LRR-repeat protein 23 n=1 Tax=Vicia villosa TaxID=3911 RepID=UPI00273BBFD8|nr:putative F-box/LRR-repeat protein 23 [Vicia villosa]